MINRYERAKSYEKPFFSKRATQDEKTTPLKRAKEPEKSTFRERAKRGEETILLERAKEVEKTMCPERARTCEKTIRHERATGHEKTIKQKRASVDEKTIQSERAMHDEKTIYRKRGEVPVGDSTPRQDLLIQISGVINMKNKRILIIPPIVLYILWLILIPIIFHGQHWGDSSAIAWLYLMSTVGILAVGCCITVIALIGIRIISGLVEWIKKGIPEEAEKEVDEYLEDDR